MRAVFFSSTPNRLAGAQRSLLVTLSSIREMGVYPTVVFPAEGMFVSACRDAALRVRILPAPPAFHIFGRALTRASLASQADVVLRQVLPYSWRLARLLDDEQAEVVHFNQPRGAIMAGMAGPLSGRNSVLHLRGAPAIGAGYWLVAQAMASFIVLVARALESELLPSVRKRARIVYNGVAPGPALDRSAARALLARRPGAAPWDTGAPVFLSLSSITAFKGLHHLLTAVAALKRKGVDAQFVLAGTGLEDPYEAWLRRRRDALGLADRVHFVGFVNDPRTLLAAADALVLPTVLRETLELDDGTRLDVRCTEGLPRSILEAMAASRPVVATNVVGVPEQVEDGQSGLLVPPSDPSALAAAIERVAGDPSWRDRAGHRGREIVEQRFTVRAAARGLADVLQEAAKAHSLAARPIDLARVCLDGFSAFVR